MQWTVLIEGIQVASELNTKVNLRSKPKEGELYPLATSQGIFLFRIEDVEDVPRKAHVALVTRIRQIQAESLTRYRQLARRHNLALIEQQPGDYTCTCHTCNTEHPAVQGEENLCPNCGLTY